jgi:phospholipid/cholesterol/gamma-HCH transport system substrate-binding protein
MNNFQQTARVGLFFLLGLALTWVTFETLRGGKVFKDQGYNLIAGFESLKELKEGDEVRMAGVKIGEVEQTRLAGRRAEAVLRISHKVRIKSDATASIIMAGLIGTNYIGIDLGTDAAPDLPDGAEIRTKTTPDLNSVMSQIGDLGKKLEGALGDLSGSLKGNGTGGLPGIIEKVDQLVTENRENISKTTANLQSITDKVNKGEGTLGKLINDPSLHNELITTLGEIKQGASEAKTFIANAQSLIDEVKAGKGAIGTLVFDQKAGEDIKASIANIRAVSEKIARGEGSLGKLLGDDSMVRDVQSLMKKADRALDGLDDTGPISAVGVVAGGLF